MTAATVSSPDAAAAERFDRIRQFEVLKGVIAAAQQAEALALADLRRREDAERHVPAARRGRGAIGEIALARRVSPAQARRWLGLARILRTELPRTCASLAHGDITEWRALVVARETVFLSRERRAEADAAIAPRLGGWSDRQVEAETRRVAQRLDPAGAAERARNAVADRRVSIRPAPDTMVRLSALLPVTEGVATYAALRRHADSLIGTGRHAGPDGTPRGRGQLMADTLVERVTGQTVAGDVPVEITLVMTDRALFGSGSDADSAEPAVLPGYGPVPAPTAREIALRAVPTARRWLRRLYLTPDGRQLAAMDSRRRLFGTDQQLFLRVRDQDLCRTPWCDAPARHADHVETWASTRRTGVRDGRGTCETCNHVKQSPGWRTRAAPDGAIVTISPTGHRYTSHVPPPPGAVTARGRADDSPLTMQLRARLRRAVA